MEEKFWSRVDRSGDCWDWTASVAGKGYGQCSIGQGRQGLAHRYSYELAYGPIPAGMMVDHTCHRKICVNPAHLRLATNKQNGENRAGVAAHNTSGYRGVTQIRKSGKWRAAIRHNGKVTNLGHFDTAEEAAAVVLLERLRLFTHNDADRKSA